MNKWMLILWIPASGATSIWSNLPDELLEKIVTRLPVLAFLQLRSVCKQWFSRSDSIHFSHLRQLSGSHNPCFLFHVSVGRTGHLVIYDPRWGKWCKRTLSFLPPGVDASLVAVSGGLLCFKSRKSDRACYLICNPLTKTYQELPPPLHYRSTYRNPSLQTLLVDEHSRSYKIILAGYSSGRDSTTKVYNSQTNSWKIAGDLPFKDDLKVVSIHPYSGQPVSNGNVYCRSHLPPGVICYNVEKESWTDLGVVICHSILSPYLVEYNYRILMIGGIGRHGRRDLNPEGFGVWELNMKTLQWNELARMPDIMYKLFLQKNTFAKFRSSGQWGIIYFTSVSATGSVVMYDLSLKSWILLPDYNLKVGHRFLTSFNPPLVWDRVFVYDPFLESVDPNM